MYNSEGKLTTLSCVSSFFGCEPWFLWGWGVPIGRPKVRGKEAKAGPPPGPCPRAAERICESGFQGTFLKLSCILHEQLFNSNLNLLLDLSS